MTVRTAVHSGIYPAAAVSVLRRGQQDRLMCGLNLSSDRASRSHGCATPNEGDGLRSTACWVRGAACATWRSLVAALAGRERGTCGKEPL